MPLIKVLSRPHEPPKHLSQKAADNLLRFPKEYEQVDLPKVVMLNKPLEVKKKEVVAVEKPRNKGGRPPGSKNKK